MQVLTTVDYANEYFETKPDIKAWNEVAYITGEQWIAEASRKILAIPNIEIPEYEDIEEIPDDIQNACCEVVLNLLTTANIENPHIMNQKLGISSISFGKDSVSYGNNSSSIGLDNAIFSEYAQSLLDKYIRKSFRYV